MELRKGHLHCYMLTTDNTTNFGTGELFLGGLGPCCKQLLITTIKIMFLTISLI